MGGRKKEFLVRGRTKRGATERHQERAKKRRGVLTNRRADQKKKKRGEKSKSHGSSGGRKKKKGGGLWGFSVTPFAGALGGELQESAP